MKKFRKILLSMALMHAAMAASAENYPYRSDVLWVTVPDHADWLYDTGQDAVIDIQLYKYGVPVDNVVVDYEIAPDMLPAEKTGSVTLKNGKARLNIGTRKTPGFRDCRLTAKVDGVTYRHHVKVGFSPDKLTPFTQKPADFEQFWQDALAEQAKYPVKYTVEEAPEYSTDKFDTKLLKISLNPQKQAVYAYLFIPRGAEPGSCPAVMCPPGAGIKTIKEPLRHRYYADSGFIRMEMEIHGLDPRMSDEQFAEISTAFNGRENGYLTNGLDNRDNFYMKRVYLALVRALDVIASLPEWDGKNLAVQGGSQGGALAIIAAALDPRVTACAANHPALSDMARYTAGEGGGYPHYFRQPGMDTPEKLNTMAYYDVTNFARLVKCPVLMTWGYNDDVCPPTTSYAVYNTISSPKEALITPVNEHWTSDATERGHLKWIQSKLK